jgi:hypothetical protein
MFAVVDQHRVLFEGDGLMENIKTYLLAVVGAAMICGIITRLVGEKGTQGAMIKLIAGLILAFTVIRPVANIRLDGFADFADLYTDAGALAASEGKQLTYDAIRASIKAQTEAYILDKAAGLDLDLEVEVTVSQDEIPVPKSVRLSGKSSPYAKSRLQAIITQELGVEKENQVWM